MPTPKEYQAMLSENCPWCGEALVIKSGKFGEFIACQNWCGYTKSIAGRSEYPPAKEVKRPCPYDRCDGSGLIPFSPEVNLYCACHHQYGVDVREQYHDLSPDDFDFPMSDTFRAYTYQYCGQQDPGYVPPGAPESPSVPIAEPVYGNLYKSKLHEHLVRMNDLEARLNSHIDASKKRAEEIEKNKKPISEYKGLKLGTKKTQ